MQKFEINLDNLPAKVLFECILRGSTIAVKHSFKEYYTFKGEPQNWREELLADVHCSERVVYFDEVFYVCRAWPNELCLGNICHVFHGSHVYSFDNYFTDCEIFREIIKQ
jgi:hypothetical protein